MPDIVNNLMEALRYCDQADTQCKQYNAIEVKVTKALKEVNKWKLWKNDPVHLLLIFTLITVIAILPASMIAIFFPNVPIIWLVSSLCLATGLIFLTVWRKKIIPNKLNKANNKLDKITQERTSKVTELMSSQSTLQELTHDISPDLRHAIALSFIAAYINRTNQSIADAEREYRTTLDKVKHLESAEAKKLNQDNIDSIAQMRERERVFKLVNEK